MPKCSKCGRWGLFLHTNYSGVCSNCVEMEQMQRDAEKRKRLQEIENRRIKRLSNFRRNIFPIESKDERIPKAWSHWPEKVHNEDHQLNLQLEALYEPVPIIIDPENQTGAFFEMTTGIIETTLLSCSCREFKKQALPCKHMYRLYYDLSHQEKIDPRVVDVNPRILEMFRALDADCQNDFICRIRFMRPDGRDCVCNDCISKEIAIGLLSESAVRDYTPFLSKMTKDEIILALAKKGIHGFGTSWSKVKLIAWVIENHSDFLKRHFKNVVHISPSPDALSWAAGISSYSEKALWFIRILGKMYSERSNSA